MIFSAFRRAHRCPTNGSLSAPRYSSIAASQCLLSSQCHQRRHSSSKPPVPPNDQSAEIETSVKSVNSRPPKNESSKIDNSKPETEKRSGAESRLGRRKGAKESISEEKNLQILNLPAVPNTNYLHEHDVSMASFFACHRPMSVTSMLPTPQAQEVFSSIFTPNPKPKQRPAQVISVLSNAVQALERGTQQQSRQSLQDQERRVRAQRRDLNELLTSMTQQSPNESDGTYHLDGPIQKQTSGESQFAATINQFAQQFRPFRVPPAPEPISKMNFEVIDGEAPNEKPNFADGQAAVRQEPREKEAQESDKEAAVYQAYLTVKEYVSRDGSKFFTAHASPLVRIRKQEPKRPMRISKKLRRGFNQSIPTSEAQDVAPRTYRERRQRNMRILKELAERTMHALSVKRQRKLKMKKHKHKKLMRKTRNLRRKLDKL